MSSISAQAIPELLVRTEVENEWWYYHGHLSTAVGDFGFHAAIFRRRTNMIDLAGFLPLRWFTPQVWFAHFAFVEIDNHRFSYGHRRVFGRSAGAAGERYHVWLRDWQVAEANDRHRLQFAIRDVELELACVPVKPLAKFGRHGNYTRAVGNSSAYVSFTRMDAQGRLRLRGQTLDARGTAWLDHDSGNFRFDGQMSGWDWFAVQLNDGRELMANRFRDRDGHPTNYSVAALIEADGTVEQVGYEHFTVAPLKTWQSPRTGKVYPVAWRLTIPSWSCELALESSVRCCELDTRGSTGVIYWEGPANVVGTLRGAEARGKAYAEIVAPSPQNHRMSDYDFESNALGLLPWLSGAIRLRLTGPGVTTCDSVPT